MYSEVVTANVEQMKPLKFPNGAWKLLAEK